MVGAGAANDNLSGHLHRYVPEHRRDSDRFLDLINCNIHWFNPHKAARRQRIKGLAQRELNLTQFGRCRVNGSTQVDETFAPGDGIGAAGRLVIVSPHTA